MTEDSESSPWIFSAFKGMIVFFLTVLQVMAIFTLLMFVPWMTIDFAGPALILSGLVFLVGNIVLLESKKGRMWGYSLVIGVIIGLGSIVLSTLRMLSFIPVPIVGNAFNATMIVSAILGFAGVWFWTNDKTVDQSGLIAASPKSIERLGMIPGSQIFQRKPSLIMAVELKEIPHNYAFNEEGKKDLTKVVEQFHNIVRTLTTIPFALRIERMNNHTRILFLTWSNDEVLLIHQQTVLHDALSYNLPNFKFVTLDSFDGIILNEEQKGAAAQITGVPLSISDEHQKQEPLEAMTGVLQSLENGVFQVFVEPKTMSRSATRSLESDYRRTVESSETTTSRDKSDWIHGTKQESKTTINPEAKMKAAKLGRQLQRLSNSQLCKTTVTCLSWGLDIARADMDVRRIAVALVGAMRPDNEQEEFRVQYNSKRKRISNLLRGTPDGDSSILTASEATNYFLLPKTDVGIPVTKREKFSSGTRDSQPESIVKEKESERVTSLVKSNLRWKKRDPSLFFGNPIDESGKIIPNAFVRTEINHLDMHLGVFGNTRSGKSTTVMNLIGQSISLGVNPVVLVPSKGYEWRKLMHVFPDVRIFTCGRNDLANLAFNIWNPPAGVRITKWIDRIVQVLTLWMPNDEVIAMHIEDVIYTVYSNCDWNLETNKKGRAILLPDLVDAVREVSERLDYGPEVSSNIFGALVARVKSILRKPALVNMYNTPTGITVSEILAHPTIIEMDALSENDKILLMGILTAAVSEYKLSNPTKSVSNLLVLEEAHYLLSGTDVSGEANSGVRLQAVSAFIEMLRVLGGTGLGVILIDQSPSSLVPQAIKIPVNMVVHALAHEDDRRLVGKHSRCTESQIDHIGGMQVGEAVVYLQHEGTPKNVKMFTLESMVHDEISERCPDEKAVAEHMQEVMKENPKLRQFKALPKDIMNRFNEPQPDAVTIIARSLTDECRNRLIRAVKSPEYEKFCTECLEEGDARSLVDLICTVSEKHGVETHYSKLHVLALTMDEYYDTDEDLKVFQKVSVLIEVGRG